MPFDERPVLADLGEDALPHLLVDAHPAWVLLVLLQEGFLVEDTISRRLEVR